MGKIFCMEKVIDSCESDMFIVWGLHLPVHRMQEMGQVPVAHSYKPADQEDQPGQIVRETLWKIPITKMTDGVA
jgi:hypothetical protein